MQHIRAHVLVCGGTGCKSAGSKEVQLEFAKQLEQKGLSDEVMIVETGCHGFCEHGPLVIIYPEGTFYCRVKPEDVDFLAQSAFDDACRPGNPRETSVAEIAELYRSLM